MVSRLKVEWIGDEGIRIYVPSSQVFQPERTDIKMISIDHKQAFALQADITQSLIEYGTSTMWETKTSIDE